MEAKYAWIIGICLIIAGCTIGGGLSDSGDDGSPKGIEISNETPIDVQLGSTDVKLLDEDSARSYLGIDDEEMKRLKKLGNLPSITIKDFVYYPREGLDKWVEENTGKTF
ncbi:hypothetical protein [Listeria newyorkensis]|uniref:Helix-turn-helix domain-containing protein n=1 Tax=Listeria newyorkensis TaxID=1497681 RepID=A0A841Z2B5_9LIST|nr:hypothetical protein [Listeria newyorkensis]MBC1458987.1 hypothetical protein [Listeria newyorkensis]